MIALRNSNHIWSRYFNSFCNEVIWW